MAKETAQRIASLMNKEENIELDEMAMSVIGEVVSQLSGTQITVLSDKSGLKGISAEPPAATFQPKAMMDLPAGEFARATYQIDLGDGQSSPMWEVFGSGVAKDIARALGGETPGMDSGGMMGMGAGMGAPMGGGFPGMGGGMGMPAMSGGMGGMQMPSMGAMGGFGMGGPAMMGQSSTNVQSIQFPNLVPQSPHGEQGNIGLIMDVYMEMTVELGRTRKLIKEILGMGEGTIIELDKLAGEPVDILVNHKLIAKGEVVVIDENFGVRVTEIVSPMERMSDMG
jgi:flagellar motor switch protein FliN/FliY